MRSSTRRSLLPLLFRYEIFRLLFTSFVILSISIKFNPVHIFSPSSFSIGIANSFPIIDFATISICPNLECITTVSELIIQNQEIVIGIPTRKLSDDGYLTLYLGWLAKITELSRYKIHFLIYDSHCHDESYVTKVANFVAKLPPKQSIFLTHEHGSSWFGIRNMATLKRVVGVGPTIVFHVNHEQPWQISNKSSDDYIYSSTKELQESYEIHPKVFRNYFYSPLLSSSVYIPVGPSLYGYMLGNSSSPIHSLKQIAASERPLSCHFTGRRTYSQQVLHNQAMEREELFHLASLNLLGGCQVLTATDPASDYDYEFQHQYRYEKYIEQIVMTAFVPCPAGNNPETFRIYEVRITFIFHYLQLFIVDYVLIISLFYFFIFLSLHDVNVELQALEARSIPLFVQPAWDKNFLRCQSSVLLVYLFIFSYDFLLVICF